MVSNRSPRPAGAVRQAGHASAPAGRGREAVTQKLLPLRYSIREDDEGRYLTCTEASNIAVRVVRGLSVSGSAARRSRPGTIYLDGAAQSEPFLDVQRRVYNLDHHEGCVRAFTLATCEQAMVMVRKGLDLEAEGWTVYANDPDLDTVLAVWILLNHRRVNSPDGGVREQIHPIVRLQGVIDSHGLDLEELCAFSGDRRERTLEIIDVLREREVVIKREGEWQAIDFLDYTLSVLLMIDELVYSARDFDGIENVEELYRVSIAADRIALVCRSDAGVYEVERHLQAVHGDRIGLLILEKAPSVFTVRQVDPFLHTDLAALYDRLNLLDPRARGSAAWGGASDIGGSPRGVGTGLSPREIAQICRWVYRPPGAGRQIAVVMASIAAAAATVTASVLLGSGGVPPLQVPGLLVAQGPAAAGAFAIFLAALAGLLLWLVRRRRPGYFGVRMPTDSRWLGFLPVVVAAGLGGGAWAPLQMAGAPTGPVQLGWWFLVVLVVGVLGVEVLFRGVVHGLLVGFFPVQRGGGRLFVSVPNAVAAVCSTAGVLALYLPPLWLDARAPLVVALVAWAVSAVLLGLICGLVRERWGSLIAPIVLHLGAGVTVWAAIPFLQ